MKLVDRIKAAELLARMCGELLDRHRIDADITLKRTIIRYDGTIERDEAGLFDESEQSLTGNKH